MSKLKTRASNNKFDENDEHNNKQQKTLSFLSRIPFFEKEKIEEVDELDHKEKQCQSKYIVIEEKTNDLNTTYPIKASALNEPPHTTQRNKNSRYVKLNIIQKEKNQHQHHRGNTTQPMKNVDNSGEYENLINMCCSRPSTVVKNASSKNFNSANQAQANKMTEEMPLLEFQLPTNESTVENLADEIRNDVSNCCSLRSVDCHEFNNTNLAFKSVSMVPQASALGASTSSDRPANKRVLISNFFRNSLTSSARIANSVKRLVNRSNTCIWGTLHRSDSDNLKRTFDSHSIAETSLSEKPIVQHAEFSITPGNRVESLTFSLNDHFSTPKTLESQCSLTNNSTSILKELGETEAVTSIDPSSHRTQFIAQNSIIQHNNRQNMAVKMDSRNYIIRCAPNEKPSQVPVSLPIVTTSKPDLKSPAGHQLAAEFQLWNWLHGDEQKNTIGDLPIGISSMAHSPHSFINSTLSDYSPFKVKTSCLHRNSGTVDNISSDKLKPSVGYCTSQLKCCCNCSLIDCCLYCSADCQACFHIPCAQYSGIYPCNETRKPYQALPKISQYDSPFTQWTNTNVLEWMTAVNLYPLIEIFKANNIRGCDLANLDDEKLTNMGITNSNHRLAILQCIKELTSGALTSEQPQLFLSSDAEEEQADDPTHGEHVFIESSFHGPEICDKCNRYLRGVIYQGLQCELCRLIIHRTCLANGLAVDCTLNQSRSPQNTISWYYSLLAASDSTELALKTATSKESGDKHVKLAVPHTSYTLQNVTIFGIGLCHQFDAVKSRAPAVLIAATMALEWKVNRLQIDLYKLYKSTSIPDDYSTELIELLTASDFNYNAYDSVEPQLLVGFIKKYLRELKDPLIPMIWYDKFIIAAKLYAEDPAASVQQVVSCANQLAIHHVQTLTFFIDHLRRISKVQYTSGRREPPTIMLQSFSHILLRPPWKHIIQVINNTEHHIRIIEILFQSFKGEVKAPTFDEAPAVPPRKISRACATTSSVSTPANISTSSSTWKPSVPVQIGGASASSNISSSTTGYSSPYTSPSLNSETFVRPKPPVPPPQQIAIKPSSLVKPTIQHQTKGMDQLKDAEWYWGKITREEVKAILFGEADGSFLVRDALSKEGEYTLTLLKDGTEKLIKICHDNGMYGFVDCKFNSVVDLINYYRNNSLILYNKTLDITLMKPIVRPFDEESNTDATNRGAIDLRKLTEKFLHAHNALNVHKQNLQNKKEIFEAAENELSEKKSALDVFCIAKEMLYVQMQIMLSSIKSARPQDLDRLIENRVVLEDHIIFLNDEMEKLNFYIERKKEEYKHVEREINAAKPEIQALSSEKDKLQDRLFDLGIKEEQIKQLIDMGYDDWKEKYESESKLPHNEENLWFLDNCTRRRAQALLADAPTGTFLIRPRKSIDNNNGNYALSIACKNIVQHCIIYETINGFGLALPYNIYASLKKLVLHYANNSLEEHNDTLTTTLKYPVLYWYQQQHLQPPS